MSDVLAAIGAFLAPIIREALPLIFDEWRKPDTGERVEATAADRKVTEVVNDEWDRILKDVDVPSGYDLPR